MFKDEEDRSLWRRTLSYRKDFFQQFRLIGILIYVPVAVNVSKNYDKYIIGTNEAI